MTDSNRDTAPEAVVARVRRGDRRALARAISTVEENRAGGPELLAAFHEHAHNARRIGITGAPGAGKSTLSTELISVIRASGASVAVMAIDPSSPFTGGAILGDRIRMQDHIGDEGVYIRSLASRGHMGGMSASAPKVAVVLDGAGFDVVLMETVGVGQAEVEVLGEADTTLVVVTPGWGDSVQANKAGLLEIGDVFVVNKADRPGADDAVRDLEMMLDLGPTEDWRPPVVQTMALEPKGIDELWQALESHAVYLSDGELAGRRAARARRETRDAVRELLLAEILDRSGPAIAELLDEVSAGRLDPWSAASKIVARLD